MEQKDHKYSPPFDLTTLIQCVKKRPIIYSRTRLSAEERELRRNEWEDVARDMYEGWDHYSVEDKIELDKLLRTKWSSAKDTFVKCAKNKSSINYKYFEDLRFLIGTYLDENEVINDPSVNKTPKKNDIEGPCELLDEYEESPKHEYRGRRKRKVPERYSDERNQQTLIDYERVGKEIFNIQIPNKMLNQSNGIDYMNTKKHRRDDDTLNYIKPEYEDFKMNPNSSAIYERAIHLLTNLYEENEPTEDLNGNKSFLFSLLPHLNLISNDKLMDVKISLMQIIQEALPGGSQIQQ